MKILAISDLVIPKKDFGELWKLLEKRKEPDLFLTAGDIVERSDYKTYKLILDKIRKIGWKCPIISVPGNWEQTSQFNKIRKECKDNFHFLSDQAVKFKIGKKTVGIVGSIGPIDAFSMMNLGGMVTMNDDFFDRVKKIQNLLEGLNTDVKILLTHYAPTRKTMKGEPEDLYPVLGSEYMERILIKTKTTLAIHGHAHYGIPFALVEKIPVFNVGLPVNNDLVDIDTNKLPKK